MFLWLEFLFTIWLLVLFNILILILIYSLVFQFLDYLMCIDNQGIVLSYGYHSVCSLGFMFFTLLNCV